MPEKVTFTTPFSEKPPAIEGQVVQLDMSMRLGRIYAVLACDNGVDLIATWSDSAGENATALMRALNKANLSTKSLNRRVIEKGLVDGKWAPGTISGAPD